MAEIIITKNGTMIARTTDAGATAEDVYAVRVVDAAPEYPAESPGRGKTSKPYEQRARWRYLTNGCGMARWSRYWSSRTGCFGSFSRTDRLLKDKVWQCAADFCLRHIFYCVICG